MRHGTQAPAKLRGELNGIRRRRKVLVMVLANNSGDRVGRGHWEESFRKHCRDDVYVCIDAEAVMCAALARARS